MSKETIGLLTLGEKQKHYGQKGKGAGVMEGTHQLGKKIGDEVCSKFVELDEIIHQDQPNWQSVTPIAHELNKMIRHNQDIDIQFAEFVDYIVKVINFSEYYKNSQKSQSDNKNSQESQSAKINDSQNALLDLLASMLLKSETQQSKISPIEPLHDDGKRRILLQKFIPLLLEEGMFDCLKKTYKQAKDCHEIFIVAVVEVINKKQTKDCAGLFTLLAKMIIEGTNLNQDKIAGLVKELIPLMLESGMFDQGQIFLKRINYDQRIYQVARLVQAIKLQRSEDRRYLEGVLNDARCPHATINEALVYAIDKRDNSVIDLVKKRDVKVDYNCCENIYFGERTPLKQAILSENLDMCLWLLEHGANPAIADFSFLDGKNDNYVLRVKLLLKVFELCKTKTIDKQVLILTKEANTVESLKQLKIYITQEINIVGTVFELGRLFNEGFEKGIGVRLKALMDANQAMFNRNTKIDNTTSELVAFITDSLTEWAKNEWAKAPKKIVRSLSLPSNRREEQKRKHEAEMEADEKSEGNNHSCCSTPNGTRRVSFLWIGDGAKLHGPSMMDHEDKTPSLSEVPDSTNSTESSVFSINSPRVPQRRPSLSLDIPATSVHPITSPQSQQGKLPQRRPSLSVDLDPATLPANNISVSDPQHKETATVLAQEAAKMAQRMQKRSSVLQKENTPGRVVEHAQGHKPQLQGKSKVLTKS